MFNLNYLLFTTDVMEYSQTKLYEKYMNDDY